MPPNPMCDLPAPGFFRVPGGFLLARSGASLAAAALG